jgi:hypothetical protein
MRLVDCYGIKRQGHTPILRRGQEHGSELGLALDPPEESELSTI